MDSSPPLSTQSASSLNRKDEIANSMTSTQRQPPVRKSFSSLADVLVATAGGHEAERNDKETESRQQELTGLGFSVRPYDGDAFNEFKGGNIQQNAGTPRRETSAPPRPAAPRAAEAIKPGAKSTKGPAVSPRAAPVPKRSDVKPPRHIKPAPFVALPPLRSRRGCLGISNRRTFAESAYEDKLRALGMTKAGTAGLKWGDRVIEYPGENGPAHLHSSRSSSPKVVGSPDVVDGRHQLIFPNYPHSMNQVLMLEPNSWANTKEPHAPTFLQVPRATQPTDAFPTRYGTNTEWTHNSFVTVQAEPSSQYYMGEKVKPNWMHKEGAFRSLVCKT
ncbi:hypothetical protein HDU86_007342 [Geranomyces michiganensis]|nr:hypothetical protein HDU86_007342 [Geranomyces michiganensis]